MENNLWLLASGYCDIYAQFEMRTKNVELPSTTKGMAWISCELKSRIMFRYTAPDPPSYLGKYSRPYFRVRSDIMYGNPIKHGNPESTSVLSLCESGSQGLLS